MANKLDIENLFRKNQHRLNERPSNAVWRRLETRLDAHNRRNRISIRRSLAMVASLLVLIVFISLLTLFSPKSADSFEAGIPKNLQELEEDHTLTESQHLHTLEWSTRHFQDQNKIIAEGSSKRNLIVQNK